jgi:hypothetical protein
MCEMLDVARFVRSPIHAFPLDKDGHHPPVRILLNRSFRPPVIALMRPLMREL